MNNQLRGNFQGREFLFAEEVKRREGKGSKGREGKGRKGRAEEADQQPNPASREKPHFQKNNQFFPYF